MNKLIFSVLSVVLVIMTMSSALAVCYPKSYDYGQAKAYANICCEYDDATHKLAYACTGDKAYYSDAPVDCDESGCGMVDPDYDAFAVAKISSKTLTAEGRHYITCWDKNVATNGDWAYAYSYCYQDVAPASGGAVTPGSHCGNGACEGLYQESAQSCPADCGGSNPESEDWLTQIINWIFDFIKSLFSGVGSMAGSGVGYGGGSD